MSATISALVRRLSSLPTPYGVDPEVLTPELTVALKTHSRDLEHARRIVERILETADTCPTPKQLAAVASDVAATSGGVPSPCPMCRENGGDWVHSERIIGGERLHFSGRCSCARGRLLAAKERENESR